MFLKVLGQIPGLFAADGRRGLVLLALLLAIGVAALGGESLRFALRYEREAIGVGAQWWRLLSAHLVHLDAAHALVNAAGLVLVWGLVIDALEPLEWWLVALVSALAVTLGLWWWVPRVEWYVGASGLLHGVLAAGAVIGAWRGDRVSLITVVLLALKLGYEQWQGPLGFTAGKPIVPVAHVLGALGGLTGLALVRLRR